MPLNCNIDIASTPDDGAQPWDIENLTSEQIAALEEGIGCGPLSASKLNTLFRFLQACGSICALDEITEEELDDADVVRAAMCVDGEVKQGPIVYTSAVVDLVMAMTTMDARYVAQHKTIEPFLMDSIVTDSFGLADLPNEQFIVDRDGYWGVELTGGFNGGVGNRAVREFRIFFRVNEGLPSQRDWPLIAHEGGDGDETLEGTYSVGRRVPLLAGDTVRFKFWADKLDSQSTQIGWSDHINNAFMSVLFIGNIV